MNRSTLSKFLPILQWLPDYQRSALKHDVIAGLSVAVMLVPQGMAYAHLAGLPPIYGLYAGIVPLLLYAFFGSSRQLSVGPVALVSLLIVAGVSVFAEPGSPEFIQLAITVALMAGVLQLILGLMRMGFVVNFLSHPVLAGFTSAAAIIIGLSQLKNLLGITTFNNNQIQFLVGDIVSNIRDTHLLTLGIGVGAIALIFLIRKIKRSLPSALLVLIASILATWLLGLDARGVEIVGTVPRGLPQLSAPTMNWEVLVQLLPLAITICLISLIESIAIAKTIEKRHTEYRVSPDQELLALGISKIGGAFFQAYPTTGSFTRSAINDEAGAKTGISSIITAIIMSLVLLFLTSAFFYLPKAILGAIIVVAIIPLIHVKETIALWKTDRRDFLTLAVTFAITLILGIQEGVLAGVLLSLGLMVYHNAKPQVAVLGRLPGTNYFRNVARFTEAQEYDNILIVRMDAQLYFGNAEYFRETMDELIAQKGPQLRTVILDASSIHDIDSTGAQILDDFNTTLEKKGIQFCLANVIGPVRDILFKSGLMDKIGKKNQFMHLKNAVADKLNERFEPIAKKYIHGALQTNVEKEK